MSRPAELKRLLGQWDTAVVREQLPLDAAIEMPFRLVDVAQQVMGSDEVFTADYGQVRSLATVGFGGGGRPAL